MACSARVITGSAGLRSGVAPEAVANRNLVAAVTRTLHGCHSGRAKREPESITPIPSDKSRAISFCVFGDYGFQVPRFARSRNDGLWLLRATSYPFSINQFFFATGLRDHDFAL